MQYPKNAQRICEVLRQHGFRALFAGGCVRDHLMGRPCSDFDIVTSAQPQEVVPLFEKTILVGAQFGVVVVVIDNESFEVASFRTESEYKDGRHPEQVQFASIEEDALRRDFTINGLYFDPSNNQIIDLVDGRRDIERKVIRAIGNPSLRFQEDHLRMMRAIRFCVQLSFEIEAQTLEAIRLNKHLLSKISKERIRDEFTKILTSQDPERGVRLLDETELLKEFLPEFDLLKGVEQPPQYHPEGDVFVHTLLLLKQLKNAELPLALGALLHDIAKPQTFERASDRIRFHGHDTLGAKMATEICKRLCYPNYLVDLVHALVEQHLRFKDVKQMRTATLKRFLSIERFDLHLELHRIDCLASHSLLEAYHFCKKEYESLIASPAPREKFVTGKDLKELGFKPGPNFRKLLTAIEDETLEGRLTNKQEALEWILKNAKKITGQL